MPRGEQPDTRESHPDNQDRMDTFRTLRIRERNSNPREVPVENGRNIVHKFETFVVLEGAAEPGPETHRVHNSRWFNLKVLCS